MSSMGTTKSPSMKTVVLSDLTRLSPTPRNPLSTAVQAACSIGSRLVSCHYCWGESAT